MSTPDPDTMDELIADCAAIPSSLMADPAVIPRSRAAHWSVDEKTAAQVAELDEYV
ncbi:hypothetical protein [Actinokineospora sp.]|uniref:hypothetical protein n=1 Tax=Actinokineospora sp. TaxID=1872133 RepID=UPI003D6BF2B0